MAFKKMEEINSSRYSHLFRLANDKDSAKVVPLYKSYSDVVVIDCHYINTSEYRGYVHCLEDGCPACQKGIAVQHKLFIPFLMLAQLNDPAEYPEDCVVFWDRNSRFDHQLQKDFFREFPNPSEVIFEITRNGEYRDINTTYSIVPSLRYGDNLDEKLKELSVSFPDYYDTICKQFDAIKLSELLSASANNQGNSNLPQAELNYEVKPRTVVDPATIVDDIPSADSLPVLNSAEEVTETIYLPAVSVSEEVKEAEVPDVPVTATSISEDLNTEPEF